jgi:hypothetical protein
MSAQVLQLEIAKRIVKVGFIVAGADGLDESERASLIAFAIDRSGLTRGEIEAQAHAASKGLASIEAQDIELLKRLPRQQLGNLLHEVVEKSAGADGLLSSAEESALKQVWSLLT